MIGPWYGKSAECAAKGYQGGAGLDSMTDRQERDLEGWRAAMSRDLASSDTSLITGALLAVTYDDPDRSRIEALLLGFLSSEVDHQVKALAVTCLGHVGRIHRAVSSDAIRRLEEFLDDPELGGTAEDALDDIRAFVGGATSTD
ncbi:hypothetical protein NLX83_40030 [Allokutzneria sp. A3M-2-11 16]|uniref:hypothetical protein n=1 Tax=Allokutzneria sp. A3M-2-11 16 TaxID=2962043 RepID=UPI0020B86B11|nr:hypothetical protein [Allokutzneria sp. A3M-2-11 16]MCP3805473.1 hypothetical protein [Allokutzneria sp. A3M-2-11 16]